MLKNEIILPGVQNSRELGGIPAGNSEVKKGVLIRTGMLHGASPEAVKTISETYHVQRIVDFRMKFESTESRDPDIPGAININLPVVEIDDYIEKAGDIVMEKKDMLNLNDRETMTKIAFESGLIGPDMYLMFLLNDRGRKAYKEFFDILIEADPDKGAILWHCTDGKDRAGLASALLLAALGAEKEVIYEDFLLTNVFNAKKVEAIKEKYADLPQDKLDAMIFVGGGVIESYLTNVFDTMDKNFSGMSGYLSEGLGLKNEDVRILRDKYLT
ncbi:MAG: tyrosine-protein phosphatase [Eubacterium sp.]|nr:tyrosine-protein phosphatase [Eubacterium sp.]